jgi:cytochrome c oxidase assembly protein subunit 15
MRTGAALSLFFMLTEALVGAGLVLFKMVAHNESIARAYWMGAHLVNTFLLLGSVLLACHWASGGKAIRLRNQGLVGGLLVLAHVAVIAVGISGAIAALGDTLFPAQTLAHGLAQDLAPGAHVLLRLRIFHPLIAILGGFAVVGAGWTAHGLRPELVHKRFAVALTALFGLQLVAGVLNVVLLAPVWLQMVHLLLADGVWLVLVRTSAEALADEPSLATEGDPSPVALV